MHTEQRQFPPADNRCDGHQTCTNTAIALCMNSPIAWSMTRPQIEVFKQLCALQIAEGGPHSLLPNVMAELLALARRPWWDRGVAGLLDEDTA